MTNSLLGNALARSGDLTASFTRPPPMFTRQCERASGILHPCIKNDKILGVVVDNNLSWSSHIDNICKKIKSNLWLLTRIKEYLSGDHRIQFYKTYTQPHIDYCNIVWGGTSPSNLDRIFRLQKRACKVILDYNSVSPSPF